MKSSIGLSHAPVGRPGPVCQRGEFIFAATHLDHGHIHGQCNGLAEAGGLLKWVYDPDPTRVQRLLQQHPGAQAAASLDQILDDPAVHLVAAAAIPNLRGPLGCHVMRSGKDYFTDKTPFTKPSQLAEAKQVVAETGKKYMVYYCERLHVECAVHAGILVHGGAIGRVVQTIGLGPHRLTAPSRPAWFFNREQYGGILCDIGSHQSEQFLYFTGCTDATVATSAVGNFANPDYPELEDFGECSLVSNNGSSGYYRVDWLTPEGLNTWGDGRTLILGTKGYIELRKYTDVATSNGGEQLILVDQSGEHRIACGGQVGFPFFGQLILDCLNRTETAMTQAHAFKAAELCLAAQEQAKRIYQAEKTDLPAWGKL